MGGCSNKGSCQDRTLAMTVKALNLEGKLPKLGKKVQVAKKYSSQSLSVL